jgi:hypothetical protein
MTAHRTPAPGDRRPLPRSTIVSPWARPRRGGQAVATSAALSSHRSLIPAELMPQTIPGKVTEVTRSVISSHRCFGVRRGVRARCRIGLDSVERPDVERVEEAISHELDLASSRTASRAQRLPSRRCCSRLGRAGVDARQTQHQRATASAGRPQAPLSAEPPHLPIWPAAFRPIPVPHPENHKGHRFL